MAFIKIDIGDGSVIEEYNNPDREKKPEDRLPEPLDRSGDLQIVEITPTDEKRKSPEPWIIEGILEIVNAGRPKTRKQLPN